MIRFMGIDLGSCLTGRYGFMGFVAASMLITAVVTLVLMVGWLLLTIVDYAGTTDVQGEAQVVDLKFEPAHTTYISVYNAASRTTTMTPVYHHDAWYVTFEKADHGKVVTDSFQVSQDMYSNISKGEWFRIMYSTGRISGGMMVTKIIGRVD